MATIKKTTNTITEILGSDVSWWVESDAVTELDAATIEHIEDSIKDGYLQGEICMIYGRHNHLETNGWWSIVNWKNIALELYHALNSADPKQVEKAKRQFDETWEQH